MFTSWAREKAHELYYAKI